MEVFLFIVLFGVGLPVYLSVRENKKASRIESERKSDNGNPIFSHSSDTVAAKKEDVPIASGADKKAHVNLHLSELDHSLLERAAVFPNAISIALEDRDLRSRISGSDSSTNPIRPEMLNTSLAVLQRKLMTEMNLNHLYFSGWENCPAEFETYRALSIPFLCHFTHISNLPSIVQHGLIPIAHEQSATLDRHTNDNARHDNRLKATSVSVGVPNEKMLWKYRHEKGLWDYVVLALDPTLIWRKTCAFCPHNAADRRVAKMQLESLIGPEALERMFGQENWTNRPADPQAEILGSGLILVS